ncbi:MAG TPA: hypothetical protein VEF34_07005 [Syntrophobacteraceae bacterium]|nr:hypothetical protein [Syntrophobacteraceae bacterium]
MRLSAVQTTTVLGVVMFCLIYSFSAGPAHPAEFQITYPASDSSVSGRVVEITGVGADPGGTIQVEVLTNEWYVQTGTPRINPDGSWSYAPCYLAGQGEFNNHTIRATIIKDGKRLRSTSVHGVVRKP